MTGKYKRGERVNFLYKSPEGHTYFEKNVTISNSSWEDRMLAHNRFSNMSYELEYYFLNPGGRIQYCWIPESQVYPLHITTPGLLYDGNE